MYWMHHQSYALPCLELEHRYVMWLRRVPTSQRTSSGSHRNISRTAPPYLFIWGGISLSRGVTSSKLFLYYRSSVRAYILTNPLSFSVSLAPLMGMSTSMKHSPMLTLPLSILHILYQSHRCFMVPLPPQGGTQGGKWSRSSLYFPIVVGFRCSHSREDSEDTRVTNHTVQILHDGRLSACCQWNCWLLLDWTLVCLDPLITPMDQKLCSYAPQSPQHPKDQNFKEVHVGENNFQYK